MKKFKQLLAWMNADNNRGFAMYPTVSGYLLQLAYRTKNGKDMWGASWHGETVEEAIETALDCEEWLND